MDDVAKTNSTIWICSYVVRWSWDISIYHVTKYLDGERCDLKQSHAEFVNVLEVMP